jgi:hypothetical protein
MKKYRFKNIEISNPDINIIGYGVYKGSMHVIVELTDGENIIEELRLEKEGSATDRSDKAIHALAIELLKDFEV